MSLAAKSCVACKGAKALAANEISPLLAQVPGWVLRADGKAIELKKKFNDYLQALEFVNKLTPIAEDNQHHPDLAFGWGYVNITLQTHDVGGLHENDFVIAAKINEIK